MPEVPKCDTDTKWAIAVRRMMAMTWSIQGCHKPTICLKRKKKKKAVSVKHNKAKHNRTRYVCMYFGKY